MYESGNDHGATDRVEATDERRGPETGSTTRRGFLATGAASTAIALAGCGGNGGTTTAGDPETTVGGPPSTPWTTEELADQVDDGTTINIYSASGDPETWNGLVDVVNDEYGTSLESNTVIGNAVEVSQRIVQERQADSDKADVITAALGINQRFYEEGRDHVEEWYELGVDEDYWFSDELADEHTERWYVSGYSGGPSTAMAINREIFEQRGLDVPDTYNDLFEDQYEGLEAVLPSFIVAYQIGWIIEHHAAQTDMSNQEWIDAMMDHLNFSGVSSHSAGGRAVGEGEVPIMFYNFPWTLSQFVPEFPVHANFVEDAAWIMSTNGLSINSEAPNSWAARFLLSATLEEPVQRRILDEVPQVIPGRLDIDYSAQNPSEYTQRRFDADTTKIGFWEQEGYTSTGETARNEWIDI